MFYIDSVNEDKTISLERAVTMIKSGKQDLGLLECLELMQERLSHAQEMCELNDEDFCYEWSYEINAYNKVVSEMSKLFA